MDHLIPGLNDDEAKLCLVRVPRFSVRTLAAVSTGWRSFFKNKEEFMKIRNEVGFREEFLCVLSRSQQEGNHQHWEVFDGFRNRVGIIPPVPAVTRQLFQVCVLDEKILYMGGYSVINNVFLVSSDVYQYNARANRWTKLADMRVPRYRFTADVLDGVLYAIGGVGNIGAEAYSSETKEWTDINDPNRPVQHGFTVGFNGRLFVVGNGNRSPVIQIYDPGSDTWRQKPAGPDSISIFSYAILLDKVYFVDSERPGELMVFDPWAKTWQNVGVRDPLMRERLNSRPRFTLGVLSGKLLLFPEQAGNETLSYDPSADEWTVCHQINPEGTVMNCATIKM